MPRAVEWTGTARRSLEPSPPKVVAAVVEFVYGGLAEAPERVGKPLRFELERRWSARRGDFLVLHRMADDRVIVDVVAHRGDAYRCR